MQEHEPRQSESIASTALAEAFAAMNRPWRLAPELSLAELDALPHTIPGATRLQAQLLHNRGVIGVAAAQRLLQADWRGLGVGLPQLDEAVARIRRALAQDEPIVVFGDYDSDGITSCAILMRALRWLGAQPIPYIPVREDDGRGLNEDAVRQFAAQGARLIITTDCGSANVAEVALARSLGVDVIVTDHHTLHGDLPECIIVNPMLAADVAPSLGTLAGAGVAFYLAEALLSHPERPLPIGASAEALLDLAAIGVVGDVSPLLLQNWALARAGLARLRTQPQPGLRALLAQAGIVAAYLTERDISFSLAPRLNAAARLGEPLTALTLLICDDPAEAQRLAARLEDLNKRRQQITDEVMEQARFQALAQRANGDGRSTPQILFVRGERWPLGIIGLVAGRLAEEFGCPAITLSCDDVECRGSGRGPEGVNLVAALASRPEFFRRFGGHERAAGFTLALDQVEPLQRYLLEHLASILPTTSIEEGAKPLEVDCRLPLSRLTGETYQAIRALAPFGAEFPEPRFVCYGARIMRCWRSGVEGRNLRVVLRDQTGERVFLWPRQGEIADALRLALPKTPMLDVVYTVDAFHRRDGAPELLLRILAMRPAVSLPV